MHAGCKSHGIPVWARLFPRPFLLPQSEWSGVQTSEGQETMIGGYVICIQRWRTDQLDTVNIACPNTKPKIKPTIATTQQFLYIAQTQPNSRYRACIGHEDNTKSLIFDKWLLILHPHILKPVESDQFNSSICSQELLMNDYLTEKLFAIVHLAYSSTMHDLYCVVFIRFVHHHKVGRAFSWSYILITTWLFKH